MAGIESLAEGRGAFEEISPRCATPACRTELITAEELDVPPEDFLGDYCEDSHFYSAFQKSKVPGFEVGYLLIRRGVKRVSVAPFFLMDYRPSLFFDNPSLQLLFGFLKFKTAFVGHPSADVGRIDGEISEEVLEAVNDFLSTKASLIVYKFFETALPLHDFFRLSGMPIPILKVGNDYFSKLHGAEKKHLNREIRLSKELEFREVSPAKPSDIPLDEIYRLYLETYHHSDMRFEKLNKDYFIHTLGISSYLLVYLNGELIGFAQYLTKGNQICGKYLGMNYEKGKPHGLYFGMMLQIIKMAIRDGFGMIDFGVSGYSFKKWLGCQLIPTFVYFRHANPLINWLLGRFKFLAEFSETPGNE